ncbi:regulator of chromosome condensation (RCC1) family protein isoform X3 [Carex rostrata]
MPMAWSLAKRNLRQVATILSPAIRLFSGEVPPGKGRRFAALWGNGDYGRLGHGGLESQWTPRVCTFFDAISHCDPLLSLSCGGAHTLFLTESGRVFATGLNNFGQLGINSSQTHSVDPVEVLGFNAKIVEISAGYHHSCAVTEDGMLFVWGNNSSGQLGLGKKGDKYVAKPAKIDCLVDVKVKMATLGSEHSIAVTDKGEVLSWGEGRAGKLGHGHRSSFFGVFSSTSEYMPRLIKNLDGLKVKSIAAGMLHSACIDEGGSVFLFGERTASKMGFTRVNDASVPSPVQDLPFSEMVSCGGYHTCVITNQGELYTWGSNENGCLGLGDTYMVQTPENVTSSLFKFPISHVSCGWKHTAIISGLVLWECRSVY